VIDWNGNTIDDSSLAWGFRWDGVAYGETMIQAVIMADPRLYAKLGQNGSFGLAVRGLGYDANDDSQFAISDDTQFGPGGIASSGPAEGATPVPPDLYREGWFISGTWSYGVANSNPWTGSSWIYSPVGASARQLLDGSWDSWAFTPTFRQSAFAANASAAVAAADFDSNGRVDGADFLTWQRNVGVQPAVRTQGDATGDGVIDEADLAAWQSQIHTIGATYVAVAVPEPRSLATCASAVFVMLEFVRHLRRSDL
jgi:hypothetical protein